MWDLRPGWHERQSPTTRTVNAAADALTGLVGPYWAAVSAGAYQVFFEPGGVIPAGHPRGCVAAAAELSAGQQAAALVFHRTGLPDGVGFPVGALPGLGVMTAPGFGGAGQLFPPTAGTPLFK